ncbi:hypothetical protein GCM10009077_00460 [Roseibium denhamense]
MRLHIRISLEEDLAISKTANRRLPVDLDTNELANLERLTSGTKCGRNIRKTCDKSLFDQNFNLTNVSTNHGSDWFGL